MSDEIFDIASCRPTAEVADRDPDPASGCCTPEIISLLSLKLSLYRPFVSQFARVVCLNAVQWNAEI